MLAHIKNSPTLKTIPVVILTTSDAETDRAKAYADHANSYIVKPLDGAGFRTVIDHLNLYWGAVDAGPPSTESASTDAPPTDPPPTDPPSADAAPADA